MKDEILNGPALVLSYVVLPGTLSQAQKSPQARILHEEAYRFWKEFWTQVFIDNGERRELTSDNFMRQDLVTLLLHENKIIGMHLYSFFDATLASTLDHSYFGSNYSAPFINSFSRSKVRTVMSWEYLSIDRKWRKSQVGVSFATVLVGMAAKIQTLLKIDAAVAVSRNDVKVTDLGKEVGARVIVPHFMMHNTPCSMILCLKKDILKPKGILENQYIEMLWRNRLDLSETQLFSDEPETKLKIAA